MLVTLAVSGGYPMATNAGKDTSEPPPAAALIAPATPPTRASKPMVPMLSSMVGAGHPRAVG